MKRAPAICRALSVTMLLATFGSASRVQVAAGEDIPLPTVTDQDNYYTGCSMCLAEHGKKYCVTEEANVTKKAACCSILDKSSALCNDLQESVTCSNTIIGGTDNPSELERYLVCPNDP